MAILATGYTYSDNDQVTSTRLNAAINSATFDSGAVDNVTTQLSGGAIIVKDAGISAGKIASNAVTAAKLESATNGQLFIGTGTGFTKATLTGGTNITVTNASGAITISQTAATPTYSYVSSDFSKTSDISAANITGLSATLTAGETYGFQIICFISCAAAGGYYFDLNGGTATATSLIAEGLSIDQGTIRSQVQVSALSSALYNTAGSATDPVKLTVEGTITVNAGGTFVPRFAQASSSGTASTVKRGSRMTFWKIS